MQILRCDALDRRQQAFAVALFSAFLTGDIKGIAEGHQKIPAEKKFLPFIVLSPSLDLLIFSSISLKDATPAPQKNLVALLAAAIVTFHKEVSSVYRPPHIISTFPPDSNTCSRFEQVFRHDRDMGPGTDR
jgi:hypothetical protein